MKGATIADALVARYSEQSLSDYVYALTPRRPGGHPQPAQFKTFTTYTTHPTRCVFYGDDDPDNGCNCTGVPKTYAPRP